MPKYLLAQRRLLLRPLLSFPPSKQAAQLISLIIFDVILCNVHTRHLSWGLKRAPARPFARPPVCGRRAGAGACERAVLKLLDLCCLLII